MLQDFYLTIAKPIRGAELKVTGSRFIADMYPVTTKDEIESYLEHIRKEFYDASHHCYAYRFGNTGEVKRAADDGEPSGTAGKPILMVIEGAKLTNVLCVVTRYFGGTKLGTGGLARAYADSAKLAVEEAEIKTVYLTDTLTLELAYEELSALERLITQYESKSYDGEFGEKVTLKMNIRKSLRDKFIANVAEKFFRRVIVSRV